MRKIFWAVLLFCAYVWVIASGREETLLKQGKALYKAAAAWFDGADIDTHWKQSKSKKSRRWD